MTLATRLAAAMILLVTIVVSMVAWLSYRNLEQALLPRVLERLETHARLVATGLESYVAAAEKDIVSYNATPSLEGVIRAHSARGIDPLDHVPEKTWRDQFASHLRGDLDVKPAYARFRLIAIDNDAREIVRVDRSGPDGSVRIVADAELNQIGDRSYFKETIKLPPGKVYVSSINLERDSGIIEAPPVPTLHVATPLFAPDQTPLGILVLDIDMRPAFDAVRSASFRGGQTYVVNARGDYLVHPDRSGEFGSQSAKMISWRHDYPNLVPSIGTRQSVSRIVPDQAGRRNGIALAPAILAGSEWVAVIETLPNDVAMAPAAAIQNTSMLVGLIAVLCAAVLAMVIARSLTRPIGQLTEAVEGIGRNDPVSIPVNAGGETGVLARAFARVMGEANAKSAALEREIEEHRRTEAARDHYAARERLFSAAVECSNDAIVTESLDGTITGWNPAAERLFGFSAEEAVGKNIDIIVPPGRSKDARYILRRIAEGERIEHHETVRRRKDGSLVEVSLSVSPIRSASGAIVGVSRTARDITESRRAQERLRESEQMARGIVETSLDGFVQIDERATILDWNSQAENIFGWLREEVLGRNGIDLLVAGPTREEMKTILKNFPSKAGHLGRRHEFMARRKDGTEFKLELSITALSRRNDMIFNGFFRDLTGKIAAEERLRQAEKMEAIGQLTGGVAHDFNNILTVITGTIEILAEEVGNKPNLAAIARMIDEAAERGTRLTQHLLAFARRQPLQPQETDVNKLILDAASLLRPTLGAHIEIESAFEDEACFAIVDPNQLTTAILNLALNARDAMPDGGKLLIETGSVRLDNSQVRISREVRPGRYVRIAVTDTGTGIPAAIRDKVFDPFFTSKEKGKGTGLGLSMVYGFVTQSGGYVNLESEEGQGTRISMFLPPGTGALADSRPATEPEIQGGTETILVVEDNQLVRHYARAQLHSLGYATLEAANAAEALAIIDEGGKFDLLFTDVIMPGSMNGGKLAGEARKRRPGLKVLYTSGYPENAIIHEGRLDSRVLLLGKPYRKSEMARMIRKALAS